MFGEIGGQKAKILIDTGAAVCVIAKKFLDSIQWPIDGPSSLSIIVADGARTQPLGEVRNITITLGHIQFAIPKAVVTEAVTYDMILGTNWMKEMNADVNIGQQVLKFDYRGKKY